MHFKTYFYVLLLSIAALFAFSDAADARTRMPEVGGYGMIIADTATFAYGSLDSDINGRVNAGEIVYLNGWQIGVYHIDTLRWVAETAVKPIIDSSGRPMVNFVTRQGNKYYVNGAPLELPHYMTEAERRSFWPILTLMRQLSTKAQACLPI